MNFELDEITLAAMTQEARQCFLDEESSEYLYILEQEIKKGNKNADFDQLLRAAHSLKGGAGIAQLSTLRELAHQLEDLLEVLKRQPNYNNEEGWMLLEWIVNEVAFLLNKARTVQEVFTDPQLLQRLGDFLTLPAQINGTQDIQQIVDKSSFLKLALEQDLEACFSRIEQLSPQDSPEEIKESLINFYNECLLLGETLDLPWLLETIEPLEHILDKVSSLYILEIVKQIIIEFRMDYHNLFSEVVPLDEMSLENENISLLSDFNQEIDDILVKETMILKSEELSLQDEINFLQNTPTNVIEEESISASQLRIPLGKLETMTNQVEELLVTRERLRLRQQQLAQVTRKIRQISRQLEPIQEQVQTFYNQLAITPVAISLSSDQNFDSLELDSYTEIHSSLQSFQELMLQVQENHADLNLINQDFSDNLDTVDSNLDALYTNLTESRLVPFGLIAKRFIPQIQSLNRRYNKLVDFSIQGENVLIDQVLLEQLQNPLTHLINNAFDHGIESVSERLSHHKSETAKIVLKASIDNHQLEINLSDDGQGIDVYKVYQRAKNKGLVSSKMTFDQLDAETILKLIFQPNFSTVETVSELSGRGVGLDLVRNKIQRLRGTIDVTNNPGQGTTFTLKIPLNLSFISLFLVQWQHRLLAIPTSSVLETIPVSDFLWLDTDSPMIKWRNQSIPVIHLSELLSDYKANECSIKSQIGLVLESSSSPLMVTVDTLISEEQLIVKPFDDTVAIPSYLVGCTILGGGEIVPVILPQAFTVSSRLKNPLEIQNNSPVISKNYQTILIAEDSVATRRLLERILDQLGFNIIVCRDGQEALEKLQLHQGRIDLIISDIEMPRLNGFELLEKIRSHESWSNIPVVMATSRTGQHHRQKGQELGANAYLGKPILPKVLLNTIEPLLNLSSSDN
ncbi:hybrid sensor histidine kinase/response regulator [Crocosphaera sp. XPORK-15E]|uniref:hybrid sensor histidine kinase/response regulator n=1 Tax=Crocosphaera sp. XPORK-15E TaxID=3110247 RepID=UPI002B2011CA|nr:response regulator [Crocosphaera sp. XPORK-15E]MEA5532597.1 response regulator [Crocosphaera sp. XPORK-15E]